MKKNIFLNKTILVTGATGSFGKSYIRKLLKSDVSFKKLIIFSRDENKQYEMKKEFSPLKYKKIRFFIGDIRDMDRLDYALKNVDIVIHAAALKQIETAEYNPFEAIKTNIIGAQNIVISSLKNNVSSVVFLSTDKACAPINLYGATKLCAEKIFISSRFLMSESSTRFIIVRYGNVNGSRGSVIPHFIEQSKNGVLSVTDEKMTRFSITMDQAHKMVDWSLSYLEGDEILIPKLPSYKLIELVKTFSNCRYKIIGIRKGEKLHEDLISKSESVQGFETKDYYILCPNVSLVKVKKKCQKFKGKMLDKNFSYSSGENQVFLKKSQLVQIVKDVKKTLGY